MMTVQDENRVLANDMLERDFYEKYRRGESDIEFMLLGKCKQQCEYCYLHKYHDQLYPDAICDKDVILSNLKATIKWYVRNKFKCRISLFSAEWVTDTKFCNSVFQILYDALSTTDCRPYSIGIPDNMSWIDDDSIVELVQGWLDKFKNDLDIIVYFSASIDGKYCDDIRKPHTDEFYSKLFKFLAHNRFTCHPMISSIDADKWIDNIKWWKETAPDYIYKKLYLLEVRDNSWTDDRIQNYLKFLDYFTDISVGTNLETDQEKIRALKRVLNLSDAEDRFWGANPCILMLHNMYCGYAVPDCTFGSSVVVRLGDMAFPLCHRLGYEELLTGKFCIENGEITHFEPKTPELLILKTHLKSDCLPHCEACAFVDICGQFCFGNAYEEYRNLLMPPKKNCNFNISKFDFLIYKYYKMGLFEYLDSVQINNVTRAYLKDLVEMVVKNHES